MGPYVQGRRDVENFLCHFPLNYMPFLLGSYFAFLLVIAHVKGLHAGTATTLFALDCLAFNRFEGLSMNNRNSCDKLSGSSKDSEVLELLPMTDGLSLLITCLLDSIFLLSAKSPLVCS